MYLLVFGVQAFLEGASLSLITSAFVAPSLARRLYPPCGWTRGTFAAPSFIGWPSSLVRSRALSPARWNFEPPWYLGVCPIPSAVRASRFQPPRAALRAGLLSPTDLTRDFLFQFSAVPWTHAVYHLSPAAEFGPPLLVSCVLCSDLAARVATRDYSPLLHLLPPCFSPHSDVPWSLTPLGTIYRPRLVWPWCSAALHFTAALHLGTPAHVLTGLAIPHHALRFFHYCLHTPRSPSPFCAVPPLAAALVLLSLFFLLRILTKLLPRLFICYSARPPHFILLPTLVVPLFWLSRLIVFFPDCPAHPDFRNFAAGGLHFLLLFALLVHALTRIPYPARVQL